VYVCARTGKDGFSMYFHFVSGVKIFAGTGRGGGGKRVYMSTLWLCMGNSSINMISHP
jgi:hypothetical protein